MHDVGYLVAGYGVTAAALVWYRWRVARRASRARPLSATLSARPMSGRGNGR